MTVNNIIAKVKQEASEDVFVDNIPNITPKKNIYKIEDFTKYHGEEFIENLYQVILDRKVDVQGKQHYLSKLQSGILSKTQVLANIYFSPEAKNKDIKIIGLKKRYLFFKLFNIPYIGYIAKILSIFIMLPKVLKRLNQYEYSINKTYQDIQNLKQELNQQLHTQATKSDIQNLNENLKQDLKQHLHTKATKDDIQSLKQDLKQQLHTKATKDDFDIYFKSVGYAKDYMQLLQKDLKNILNDIDISKVTKNQQNILNAIQKHKFDTLYVEFEDQFRGSQDEIKQKQKIYLPFIQKYIQDSKILDIGSGRGEWLQLLKENKFINIQGVDLNKVMVQIAQKQNLDVTLDDAISYVKTLKDNSFDIITSFHLIEHLPFDAMMELFTEIFRILKKDGMIILETPNPRNILVGASDFYMDPTHINPIHPLTLKFLIQQVGFVDANSYIISSQQIINFDDIGFENIEAYINIGRDLSVIGYKK